MVSYSAPTAPTLPNPVGLDAKIQQVQLALAAGLPWLAVSYGKAYRGSRSVNSKTVYFPEVYHAAGEYRDVLPNDNVQAQSFLYPKDPASNLADEPSPVSMRFTVSVDIVFWYNLERIDPAKTYRFDQELKREVLQVLSRLGGLLVRKTYDSADEVFRGFSLDTVAPQCLRQPYGGFRISCDFTLDNVLC
ncbi:hypothetical protein LJ737_04255 [Hymenobacter sp. 15J16-1T3B]|uniref:hypothetical protein n=1 Tax=Hymenobacter sp. 15J16-1T3B TaxID=2886941 RepID=UPI001D11A81E|nr:hypothetical protein [Hymenobacter sp. 15J16-1T3B]MCC3156435.1 hypothetical protein [Hymenobacter sp. 15J16-1T3B]